MAVTEITLTGGTQIRVDGGVQVIETAIVSAARGSILELAWLTEAQTGQRVAINPDHVVMLREVDSG
jgi:hypothetical protein